jgi:hypothetical protein
VFYAIKKNKIKMILNLVLDTNTWLYLSYGFDVLENNIDENLHFELIEKILEKIESNECHVYTNYIIRDEWLRNKEKTKTLINRYKNQIDKGRRQLKNKRKSKDYTSLAKAFKEKEAELREKIKTNEKHIENVDKLIQNSHNIPITDEHKLQSVELALKKKPPFHHKNNSVADAIIFLSTIDYFHYYDDDFTHYNTIFVSNNSSDFGESVKSRKLHPDLAKMIEDKPIVFERNLAVALKLGDSIIRRYIDYLVYVNKDSITCMMFCKGTEYYIGEVEFDKKIQFKKDDFDYTFDPNQLLLDFGKNFKYNIEDFVSGLNNNLAVCDFGICDFCTTEHFRCRECGEEHPITDEKVRCHCGTIYDFEKREIKKTA